MKAAACIVIFSALLIATSLPVCDAIRGIFGGKKKTDGMGLPWPRTRREWSLWNPRHDLSRGFPSRTLRQRKRGDRLWQRQPRRSKPGISGVFKQPRPHRYEPVAVSKRSSMLFDGPPSVFNVAKVRGKGGDRMHTPKPYLPLQWDFMLKYRNMPNSLTPPGDPFAGPNPTLWRNMMYGRNLVNGAGGPGQNPNQPRGRLERLVYNHRFDNVLRDSVPTAYVPGPPKARVLGNPTAEENSVAISYSGSELQHRMHGFNPSPSRGAVLNGAQYKGVPPQQQLARAGLSLVETAARAQYTNKNPEQATPATTGPTNNKPDQAHLHMYRSPESGPYIPFDRRPNHNFRYTLPPNDIARAVPGQVGLPQALSSDLAKARPPFDIHHITQGPPPRAEPNVLTRDTADLTLRDPRLQGLPLNFVAHYFGNQPLPMSREALADANGIPKGSSLNPVSRAELPYDPAVSSGRQGGINLQYRHPDPYRLVKLMAAGANGLRPDTRLPEAGKPAEEGQLPSTFPPIFHPPPTSAAPAATSLGSGSGASASTTTTNANEGETTEAQAE